jgi:heat shock protein HslJ
MRHPSLRGAVLLCVASAIVAACGPDPIVDGLDLNGTRWRALEVAGLPPVVGSEPTFAHHGVNADGRAGCNSYSWTYRSFPGGVINVAGLSQEENACPAGNPALAQVEERFISALKAAQRMDIVDGRLEISTGLGTLVFARVE